MLRVAMSVLSGSSLAGCNTMAGFGRDVQRLGDRIEDKAE